MTRRGDMRRPSGPRYSAQAYDRNTSGVYDHWRQEWVDGHFSNGRNRRSQASKDAAAMNAQNGGRS
jgi:hypothetical protein